MKTLLIDNYDSFTYNIFQLLEECGTDTEVKRNDEIDISTVGNYERIIIGPGPGLPSEAGSVLQIIGEYSGEIPILGICLGHQAIAEVHGGSLENLAQVYHGVSTDAIRKGNSFLLKNLPEIFPAGRYHSWIVKDLPPDFIVTAEDISGSVLAFENRGLKLAGVQFHPESILTPNGKEIIQNFLDDENYS